MNYQDEIDRKASMHDYWQNKAFDLLCQIVELDKKVAHLEWREEFLSQRVDSLRSTVDFHVEENERLIKEVENGQKK